MSFSSQGFSAQSFLPQRFAAQHPVVPGEPSQPRPRRTNAVGRPRTVSDDYMQRLKELVSHDPREFGYPFRRWTARWLNQHLSRELEVMVSDRHVNRLLKQMGLSTRTSYASTSLARRQNAGLHIQIADLQATDHLSSVEHLSGENQTSGYPAESFFSEVGHYPSSVSGSLDFG